MTSERIKTWIRETEYWLWVRVNETEELTWRRRFRYKKPWGRRRTWNAEYQNECAITKKRRNSAGIRNSKFVANDSWIRIGIWNEWDCREQFIVSERVKVEQLLGLHGLRLWHVDVTLRVDGSWRMVNL